MIFKFPESFRIHPEKRISRSQSGCGTIKLDIPRYFCRYRNQPGSFQTYGRDEPGVAEGNRKKFPTAVKLNSFHNWLSLADSIQTEDRQPFIERYIDCNGVNMTIEEKHIVFAVVTLGEGLFQLIGIDHFLMP